MKLQRSLQERLSTQRALIGLLQTHPNPALAEMAGMCGYDFLILDCEHGLFSDMDHLQTLQAVGSTDVLVLVRLAGHDTRALGRYLDLGANGIVAPNVATGEEARALVSAMDYPPIGTRGFGAAAHRATRYGIDVSAHLKSPRAGASLVPIIESALGVANVDDILSIDGVDGVFIGPSDLSANLGCAGNYSSAEYAEAMTRIESSASARCKMLGTGPHPGYPLETLLDRGHRLLIVGVDMPLIREAMLAQVSNAKSCL
jgi:2-keto-3-deoxy-L-rhamnonate aldolase RhmA